MRVGHEVGTALTPLLRRCGVIRHTFHRHSFDPFRAPTRHIIVARLDDVLDTLPPTRRRLIAGALLLGGRARARGTSSRGRGHGRPGRAGTRCVRSGRTPARSSSSTSSAPCIDQVSIASPRGSRVADAVARAGGSTRKADLTLVNLAAPLADGTQVVVPVKTPAGRRARARGRRLRLQGPSISTSRRSSSSTRCPASGR